LPLGRIAQNAPLEAFRLPTTSTISHGFAKTGHPAQRSSANRLTAND